MNFENIPQLGFFGIYTDEAVTNLEFSFQEFFQS